MKTKMTRSRIKLNNLLMNLTIVGAIACTAVLSAQTPPRSPAGQTPQRKSSLPESALVKAREAEKLLAADKPDDAIAILREVDREHPGHPAISLRLAQINDTIDRSGYALFYYRRYVQLAGANARDIAVERVMTLELMPGIDDEARQLAAQLGESTRPIATPTPKVERMIATRAKDGTIVPIRSEEDLEKIQKQGIPATAPSTPIPTPEPAIVLPEELIRTPAPTAAPAQPALVVSQAQPSVPATNIAASAPQPDEDALLAQAFLQAEEPGTIETPTPAPSPTPAPTETPTPRPQIEPVQATLSPAAQSAPFPTPPVPALTPSTTPAPQVIFTKPTPQFESARAASFFHIAAAPGSMGQVALLNEVPDSVITMSITPKDNSDVVSAILVSGETKTMFVKPGEYTVTATVNTTDYSPITLLNTTFTYTFEAGRQYSHRFTKTSIQQVN